MRQVLRIAAVAFAVAMAAPVQARPIGSYSHAGNGSIFPSALKPQERGVDKTTEGYAEQLRVDGHCDRALPIFRRIINSPQKGPITEYNLGLCLLDLAAAEGDATKAAGERQKGATWVLRAANGGFNLAQEKAVALYLDGIGVAADPVEAEKWALIYHDNGMRLALGLPDIKSELRDRLDATLSQAQRDQAQARADAWVRPVQAVNR